MLDTLTDLADSMNAALARLGFPSHPVDAYRYFVGDGMETEARRALPKDKINAETIKKCLTIAREEYACRWVRNTRPYPGIAELLTALEERKIRKAILSNKPDDFTQIIVTRLLSCWTFDLVRGLKPPINPKPDPAAALQIATEFCVPPHKILYLGDTNTDMQTANNAGMFAVGALWGFRTSEELKNSGAKTLVETPLKVLNLLDE